MTTLTTRPLPLIPLALAAKSMTCNERSSSPTGSPSSATSSINMHPDNLLLQNHGVTSPRLSSTGSAASGIGIGGGQPYCSKTCDSPSMASDHEIRNSPKYLTGSTEIEKHSNTISYKHGMSSDQSEVYSNNIDDDNVTDRMSCCSDDSELSVGQECCDNNNSENSSLIKNNNTNNNNNNNNNNSSIINNGKLTNNINFNQINDDCESVDNVSSLSDDNRLTSSGEHLVSDELSNDSTPNNHDIDPLIITNAMRISAPAIVRPSPTRLQEEFLRKSQLYAEELMKQQMQFMAAARASAFQVRHGTIATEKVGFRPHIKQSLPPEINDNLVNFSGIHSHLNAISKISSQLTNSESALSKLTAFGMSSSREPSQSPPSLHQLHANHHHHLHQNPYQQFMNDNLNESNLKFSIDNILKADFGRRITDPLLKRSNNNNGHGSNKTGSNRKITNRNLDRKNDKHGAAPIDLTNVVQQQQQQSSHISASSSTGTNNSATTTILDKNHCLTSKSPNLTTNATAVATATTNATSSQSSTTSSTSSSSSTTTASAAAPESSSSSSSGGPMVWPAWVYCTRYSDRPSSGPRSSGPRTRKPKKAPSEKGTSSSSDEKRPRTAFSGPQLARLKHEFTENRYLTERRRQQLSAELGLNEAQIKIWFQNKRAKIKKASGTKNPLALQLMAQGLYNHSTVPLTREEEELQELQAKGAA